MYFACAEIDRYAPKEAIELMANFQVLSRPFKLQQQARGPTLRKV
jgi:hypothetical protein